MTPTPDESAARRSFFFPPDWNALSGPLASELENAASPFDPVHERADQVDVVVCPGEVRAFAESMLADVRWKPDPIFMLDMCEASGRLSLVEINRFSNSWLYQCDLSAVVAWASRLATVEWERRQGGGTA
jgi:hypothetical protein